MSATEQEVREAIEGRKHLRDKLAEAFAEASLPVGEAAWHGGVDADEPFVEPAPEWDVLWWDIRPSQAVRLHQLVGEARDRALSRCQAIIVDELTAAGVQFAAEYPDAPRAREKVPA
ncbi:MAG TPA: hypothetical protein VMP67_06135 [Candidatus Limnocylindria bacterium]|nr:hypothetical protein [Candidatus Limnocylindria bacterium]